MFRKPVSKRHINPRFRAYGKARIDIAQRAHTRADWDKLWKGPINPFPFEFGDFWNHCIEYKVDDFPAEVGFFIDVLGLPVNAFDPDYAMFTSPGREFFFAIVPAREGQSSTPPDALRIQFFVADIQSLTAELKRRGVEFVQEPQPCEPGSDLCIGSFRTPHGIAVELWGWGEAVEGEQEGDFEDFKEPDDDLEELVEEDEALTIEAKKTEAFDEFGEGEERIVAKFLPDIYEEADEDEEQEAEEPEEVRARSSQTYLQPSLRTFEVEEAGEVDDEEDDGEFDEEDLEDEEDVEYVDEDLDFEDPEETPWGKKYS